MALAVTNRRSQLSAAGFGTGNFTCTAFTPSNSSLLVVFGGFIHQANSGKSGTDMTIADSLGTLTWTSAIFSGTTTVWGYGCRIWTAPIGTGASMTVTLGTGGVNAENYVINAMDFTGYNTSTPTGATASGKDADGNGAGNITLSGSPASDSIILAGVSVVMNSGTNTVSPGTGWNEIYDTAETDWVGYETEYLTSPSSTSVDWVDLSVTGNPAEALMIAVEIKAAAGGATRPVKMAGPWNGYAGESGGFAG